MMNGDLDEESSPIKSKEIDSFISDSTMKLNLEIEANFDLRTLVNNLQTNDSSEELNSRLQLWKAAQVVWIYQYDAPPLTSSESSDIQLNKFDIWGMTTLEPNHSSQIMSSAIKWQQTLTSLLNSFLMSSDACSSFYMIPNVSFRKRNLNSNSNQSLNDVTVAFSRTNDGSHMCVLSGVHQTLLHRLQSMEIKMLKVTTSSSIENTYDVDLSVDMRQLSTHGRAQHSSQGSTLLIKGRLDISLAMDVIIETYFTFICSSKFRPNTFRFPDLVSQHEFQNANKSNLAVTSFDCRAKFKRKVASTNNDDTFVDYLDLVLDENIPPAVNSHRHKIKFEGFIFTNTIPSLISYLQFLAVTHSTKESKVSSEYIANLKTGSSGSTIPSVTTTGFTKSRNSTTYKNPFLIVTEKAKVFKDVPSIKKPSFNINADPADYFFLLSFNPKDHSAFQSRIDSTLSIAAVARTIPDFSEVERATEKMTIACLGQCQTVYGSGRLGEAVEKVTSTVATPSNMSVYVVALTSLEDKILTESDEEVVDSYK